MPVGSSAESHQSLEECSRHNPGIELSRLQEECSSSTEERRWHDIGIQLGEGNAASTSEQAENVPTIALDFDEARRQYKHSYGKPGSRYEDLFGEFAAAY